METILLLENGRINDTWVFDKLNPYKQIHFIAP
jgi:hypothetical protein